MSALCCYLLQQQTNKFKLEHKRFIIQSKNMQPQQPIKSSANPDQPFDQKPIGFSQKAPDMSEYPPDFNPDQINEQKTEPLPLIKRVHSKVWKIRKQAFQQLLNEVTDNWKIYAEYFKDTVTFITDANSMCQQRALKVLLKYLESAGKCLDQPRIIIKALIQKCLTVQKGQTPNLATEIMFWLMDNYPQVLLNQVNDNILNKNPKISASTLSFLQKLLNSYGAKKLKQFEQFSKNFTLLASSVRPVAKQQCIGLFKQMFKWMGQNALAFNMHPEVKQEVVKFSKTYVKQPMVIKRGLNEDQKKSSKPIVQNADDDQNDETQDVLIPYDSRWVDKVLEETKWKDKKSILDEFIKKTKVKNIINRDASHYITLIKRLLTDNNINLLQCGFKIIKNLSCGLKKNFVHPCKVILSLVFSKLRDTKAMIVDQAQQTLSSMMHCLVVDDLIQDVKEGLTDKAPNMRFQVLKFIEKLLTKKDKKMLNAFKILTVQIVELSQDGSSEVRDKALDVLCKMKVAYGINFFGDKLKKIQGKKLQTIQNYVDPNDGNKIDEQPIQQKSIDVNQKIFDNKKSVKSHSPQISSVPINSSQTHQSQTQNYQSKNPITTMVSQVPKVNQFVLQNDFESASENTRLAAYQNISQKPAQTIFQQLIQAFKNGLNIAKQSNPNVLKIVLICVKKSVHNAVCVQHMEFLMHHDWKKCKPLLIEFIQNNKLNLMALEYVKNTGILGQQQVGQQSKRNIQNEKAIQKQREANSNTQSNNTSQGAHHLRTFYNSIQNLIPKMSNPDPVVRLQSASTALQLLKPISMNTLSESVEPNPAVSQAISQLFSVLKFRIQDSNQQISNSYIHLTTELLSKGFLTKYRTPGRLIISMLLQRLNNRNLTNLQYFIKEMVMNHSIVLWQFLSTQIAKQNLCLSVLNVIKQNNQSFFKNADQKSYILPLLTCISKDLQVQKCGQLLDQIIEINGQQSLQRIVKQSKLSGFSLDNYLKKWRIHPNPTKSATYHQPVQSVPSSKMQRLACEHENPWPLVPSPTHILKMLTQMMSLGEPFQYLASPTLLNQQQLSIVVNLRNQIIQDYSDLLTKWAFWRMHIQMQPRNVQIVLQLVYRMISIGFQLQQSEIITILGVLISCLSLHKLQYSKQVFRINSYLNQHPLYKQKAFRFWINSFNDPSAPVDQILTLIIHSCADMISSQMVTLARYPAVFRNKQFNQYLRANYTQKLLTVYGFKLQDVSKVQQKQLISEHLKLNILTEVEAKYFVELFQRHSSAELVDKIIQDTEGIPYDCVMETHLKIMNAIIIPYLHRELSFINVYNYFKHVQKIILASNCASSLLNLVQTLSYFLIDIDELKLQNFSQLLKTINKLLLILLQTSDPRHIVQVLFLILKQQIRTNSFMKLNLLLVKCIAKVLKSPALKAQSQRQTQNKDRINGIGEAHQTVAYVVKEFVDIISKNDIASDSLFMKTVRNIFMEITATFPSSISTFQQICQINSQKLPSRILTMMRQLIQDKIKQNNSYSDKSQKCDKPEHNSFVSSQSSYVQSKDTKNTNNLMKALKAVVTEQGILRKNIQKMGQ